MSLKGLSFSFLLGVFVGKRLNDDIEAFLSSKWFKRIIITSIGVNFLGFGIVYLRSSDSKRGGAITDTSAV